MIPRYKSPSPKSVAEYYAAKQRAAERRSRRKGNADFQAKIKGIDVLTSKTVLKKQIDDITSIIVRRRDRKVHAGLCLICMIKQRMCILKRSPNPITQSYHIIPRGDLMTRWMLINQVGSCWACNMGEKESRHRRSSQDLYRRIHIELLGGGVIGQARLEDLEYMANQRTDWSLQDLIEKRDDFKSLLSGKKTHEDL